MRVELRERRGEAGGQWGESLGEYAVGTLATLLDEDAHARGYEELEPDEDAKVARARASYAAFVEYCFVDAFHRPIVVAPFQRDLFEHLVEHQRAVVELPNECGKSAHLVYRTLQKLGRRPKTTAICLVMDAAEKAWKTTLALEGHILNNAKLHRVYPELRKGYPWRRGSFNIDGRSGERNPSWQAIGIGGQINGDRLTDIELDDVLTFANTLSEYQRRNLVSWVENEVISRLMADPGGHEPGDFHVSDNFVINGHPWVRDDLIDVFRCKRRFVGFRRRLIECSLDEIREPIHGVTEHKILWPEAWPMQRIQDALEDQGEAAFLRTKQMEVRAAGAQAFKDDYLLRSLMLGADLAMLDTYAPAAGEAVAIGMDLANADKVAKADLNAFAALLWDGARYRVLGLRSDREKRWEPDEHIRIADEYFERLPGATFVVESNYGQKHFAQFGSMLSRAHFEPLFTGAEKRHPVLGVEGVAIMMQRNAFALPSGYRARDAVRVELVRGDGSSVEFSVHPEIAHFVRACQDYRPEDRHIPDLLAAVWKAFSWLGGVKDRAVFLPTGGAVRPVRQAHRSERRY